jgi:DNA-binding LytR/AlgR family response regulator
MQDETGMKILVIDSASPEHARLCRLLGNADCRVVKGDTGGIVDLLARLAPGQLVLVQSAPDRELRQHFCVRVRGGLHPVPVGEVRYFLAEHKYVWVRTAQTRLLIPDSLQSLAGEFAGQFVRIHRNALVATRYLTGLTPAGRGRWGVSLDGIDESLMVSRRRLPAVRRLIRGGQERPDDPVTAKHKVVWQFPGVR